MLSKASSILIIAMMVFLMILPVSAYDYRGVPDPGDNAEEVQGDDTSNEPLDLSGILGSADITSLISFLITLFLRLLGITTP